MKFEIAVAQMEIQLLAPEENLRKAEEFIKKAKAKRANVIVFPEDFMTGPVLENLEFADGEGKYRNIFSHLAQKYEIDIVAGSIIEKTRTGIYNTTYYINAKGRVRGKYRKINLWHSERSVLTPGNQVAIFNTKYGKAGLVVCWDLMFPELFRKMMKMGVKIVYCPSFWLKDDAGAGLNHNKEAEAELICSLSKARAMENGVVFVYANAAGAYESNDFRSDLVGRSQICLPFVGTAGILPHNKEELLVREVDTSVLDDSEKVYKLRADAKSYFL